MASVSKFEDLEVWQKARVFCQQVNQWVKNTPLQSDYSLKNQLERSSGSVMDNIAEGFERSGNKEFIYFLFISGSAGESRSQLYRLRDKDYISEEELEKNIEFLEGLSRQINSFISYLKTSAHKGWHFKEEQADYGKTEPQIFKSSNQKP